jgi:hypothetical protein
MPAAGLVERRPPPRDVVVVGRLAAWFGSSTVPFAQIGQSATNRL